MKRTAFVLAIAAIGAVAACSNGNDTGSSCSRPTASLPTLLYPAPGSSNVTPDLLFVAVANLGGAGGYVQLVPNTGTVLTGAQFVQASPGPLPSPSVTAAPGQTVYSSAVTPPLISAQTYTVQFVHNTQPPCGPQQPSGSIGTFSVSP